MFETIFTPYGVHRHRSAPLLLEREEFLAHLQRRGTGPVCLRAYASRLNQIVRFLNLTSLRGVGSSEINLAAQRWANYRGKHRHLLPGPWSAPSFVWLAKRWFRFHGRLLLPYRKFAFTDELKDYAEFMESKRRLSPFTVRSRLYQTARFLQWSSKYRRKRRLYSLSLKEVDGYFAAMANRWGRVSLSSVAAILRAFFVYAEGCRRCSPGIARGIKGPPIRLDSSAPGGPTWNEVLRLLRTTTGRTLVAVRARAILLLLCMYGLRRGEIVRLQLNDFDWRNGIFTVRRSKKGGLQQFPLRPEVSDSVLRYINSARPQSASKHLFLSFHPPLGR
jgi:integrase/recombinase XerD